MKARDLFAEIMSGMEYLAKIRLSASESRALAEALEEPPNEGGHGSTRKELSKDAPTGECS